MKTFALLAVLFLAACGGQTDTDENLDDAKVNDSEPITWVASAQKASARYTKDGALMHVEANPGPTDGIEWTFTFANFDTGVWAVVQSDGHTAKVVKHYTTTARPMGLMGVDLPKVKVTVDKLMKIADKAGCAGRVGHIELAQALTADMHPHWFVQRGGNEIAVDAYNGKVLK